MCGDFFLSLPANKEDAVGDEVRSETFCSASQRETEEERGEKVTVATRELLASTPERKLSVENQKKKKQEKSIFRAKRFEVFPLSLIYRFFLPQWNCHKRLITFSTCRQFSPVFTA